MTAKTKTFFFLLTLLIVTSCSQKLPYGGPLEKPADILKNSPSFVNYWITTMDLSKDFIGLDSFSNTISKGEFLKRVASGNYLPVRLLSDSASKIYYRLYKLNTSVDPYITTMLASIGAVAYKDYRWEELALPEINYTDLNGKKYNSDFIKDKTLVLDFWFIGCTACVHEFPELNKLKNKYAGAKDMLFVGIAWDKEKDLRKFLKKTDFQFDVVSDTSAYLAKTLGIQFFPTEVVVKNGKVVKTFDDQYHALPDLKLMLKNVTPD